MAVKPWFVLIWRQPYRAFQNIILWQKIQTMQYLNVKIQLYLMTMQKYNVVEPLMFCVLYSHLFVIPGILSWNSHLVPGKTGLTAAISWTLVSRTRPEGWPPTFIMKGLPVTPTDCDQYVSWLQKVSRTLLTITIKMINKLSAIYSELVLQSATWWHGFIGKWLYITNKSTKPYI